MPKNKDFKEEIKTQEVKETSLKSFKFPKHGEVIQASSLQEAKEMLIEKLNLKNKN